MSGFFLEINEVFDLVRGQGGLRPGGYLRGQRIGSKSDSSEHLAGPSAPPADLHSLARGPSAPGQTSPVGPVRSLLALLTCPLLPALAPLDCRPPRFWLETWFGDLQLGGV